MSCPTIEKCAKQTAKYTYTDEKKQIDPFTILMLIGVITAVIQAIQKCMEEKNVPTKAKKRGVVERVVLNRIVKRHIEKDQWKLDGKQMVEAIFKVGEESSVEDVKEMYKEVNE